jgi:hypothetical protein
LIERIKVSVDQIDIRLRPSRLATLFDVAATPPQGETDDETQILSVRYGGPHHKLPQGIELSCRFSLERVPIGADLGPHPSRLRGLVCLMLARDSA